MSEKSKISVVKISDESQMKQAFAIREEVFVKEQNVAPDEEYDEYEEESHHFLAQDEQGKAVGTARWRFYKDGMKLERFAVLKSHRGQGVGSKLVESVIKDIQLNQKANSKFMFLHAQLGAIPLYEKFGFEKVGKQFDECGIQHFKMIKFNE